MKRSFAYAATEALHRVDLLGELRGNAEATARGTSGGGQKPDVAGRTQGKAHQASPSQMPDICARKHGGNPESQDAHKTIRGGVQARRDVVYSSIRLRGDTGTTVDEYADHFGLNPNAISGRFSELARDDRIEKIGRRKTRSGCWAAVWRVK